MKNSGKSEIKAAINRWKDSKTYRKKRGKRNWKRRTGNRLAVGNSGRQHWDTIIFL